jgi:hypothetical protein
MSRYRTSFTTATSIEDAFDYLSRFSSSAEWDPGVVRARDLTPGPVQVGSAFEVVSSFAGRETPMTYEVVELDRPTRVVVRAETSAVVSRDEITFETQGDGRTQITYDADLRPRGVTRLIAPVLALAFKRIGDRAAAGLRDAVDRLGATRAPDRP